MIGATVFASEVAFAYAVPRNYILTNTNKVEATFLSQLVDQSADHPSQADTASAARAPPTQHEPRPRFRTAYFP